MKNYDDVIYGYLIQKLIYSFSRKDYTSNILKGIATIWNIVFVDHFDLGVLLALQGGLWFLLRNPAGIPCKDKIGR